MAECEYYEGQIAAALYEPLSDAEQAAMEAHLADCAACRETQRSLAALVAAIPAVPLDAPVDMLPRLRWRLMQEQRRRTVWKWALPAAALFLVGIYAAGTVLLPPAPAPESIAVALSPVDSLLEEALAARQAGFHEEAFQMLSTGLGENREDPRAGEIQMALADLEFNYFQHYDRAHAAYARLQSEYWDTFAASPENTLRLNLLAEAEQQNFEPLYAIDRARDSFENLEEVVAKYPATYVASRAVNAMETLVVREAEDQVETVVAALEQVRERCTNPVAVAQVNLALAEAWKGLANSSRARELYQEVQRSPELALARAAERGLAELEQGTRQ